MRLPFRELWTKLSESISHACRGNSLEVNKIIEKTSVKIIHIEKQGKYTPDCVLFENS